MSRFVLWSHTRVIHTEVRYIIVITAVTSKFIVLEAFPLPVWAARVRNIQLDVSYELTNS